MYDPVRDRVVIVGGYDNPSFVALDDVWALSLDGDPAWASLAPSGPHPPRRWGHASIYDPLLDRMVMHGGLGPGLDQTWALTWGEPATAVPTLVNVQANASLARLTWDVSGGSFFTATIYRAVEGGGWVASGNAPINAQGHAVFEDHAVAPGARYAYRAAVQSGSEELLSSPTWVTIPGALGVDAPRATLAILGVRQMGSALSVRYSLPSAAPARIALVDVGGRTLASGDVGSAGSGNHEVALEGRGGLAPGVYWVSLRQNGAAANFKALVVR